MAWIEKVERETGRAWRVGYRGPDRRQRYKTFTRKADANLFAATVETDLARGDWTDPLLGKVTVAEWARQVEASRLNRRRSTIARDDSYLRSFVLPAFGVLRLVEVQPVAVQQWVAELNAAGYAPATIRKAYEILGRTFTAAVESRLIARSPCQGVKLPKIEQTEKRFLSPTEIEHLANVIHPRFRALVLTAAYSGARFGELAGLGRQHYEPLKRTIRIERNLTEVRGLLAFGETKTRAARRIVSIPAWLVDVLAEHIATYHGDDDLIFAAPASGPLRRASFRTRHWKPAVQSSVGEPCRFHDMRHTHVALLIEQGAHPSVIASRLGHTSVRTVLDVYGHLFEGLDRDIADSLDAPSDAPAAYSQPTSGQERVIDFPTQ
ncbi:tyrosine-type recombinase/integrase [Actinomycetota bacterium]